MTASAPGTSGPAQQRAMTLGRRSVLLGMGAAAVWPCARADAPVVRLASLDDLSLRRLRERDYAAAFAAVPGATAAATDRTVAYRSDGLRVYARVSLPPADLPQPAAGWPVLLWAHGYVGSERVSDWRFDTDTGSVGNEVIRRYAQAGHVVVVPGFRGHGTVAGRRAEGLEWVRAFDNGSYLSPILYAIDLLHALQALPSLSDALPGVAVDTQRVSVAGYSQGGDVALTALAAASAPNRPLRVRAGVIWAGCIAGRLEQARFFGGMHGSADALQDPAFFAHMPAWWRPDMYVGSLAEGIARKHQQLLDTVRLHVAASGQTSVQALAPKLARIDAWSQPELIQAPLQLHFSDQDHYSPPTWNEQLARSMMAVGGRVEAHVYRGNTHSFGVETGWSPADAIAGLSLSIARSLAFTQRSTPG